MSQGPETQAQAPQRWIAIGATCAIAGLLLCLPGWNEAGGLLSLTGIVVSIVGLHRLGRSGPSTDNA